MSSGMVACRYGLGQTYELLRMFNYALDYYRKATALRPFDSRMWCALGGCYEELGRMPDALRCYKRATAHDDLCVLHASAVQPCRILMLVPPCAGKGLLPCGLPGCCGTRTMTKAPRNTTPCTWSTERLHRCVMFAHLVCAACAVFPLLLTRPTPGTPLQSADTIDCAEALLYLAAVAKDRDELVLARQYATRALALPFAVRCCAVSVEQWSW